MAIGSWSSFDRHDAPTSCRLLQSGVTAIPRCSHTRGQARPLDIGAEHDRGMTSDSTGGLGRGSTQRTQWHRCSHGDSCVKRGARGWRSQILDRVNRIACLTGLAAESRHEGDNLAGFDVEVIRDGRRQKSMLAALTAANSPAQFAPSHSNHAKIFDPRAEFRLHVRFVAPFDPGTVLIFFLLLCRFSLDIDVA